MLEQWEMAKFLIEEGADLDVEDEYGAQPLLKAVSSGNYEISKLLLERGADLTHENVAGICPLSLAREADAEEFIELLESHSSLE